MATGCYTVTKIIDVVFGWVWKRKVLTSVVCKYVTIPWFLVLHWNKGAVEHGSSGSGMFSTTNRLFGTLSGDPLDIHICSDVVLEPYGKLFSSYPAASIRNILNPHSPTPGKNLNIDNYGMNSRKITCYPSLNLPGEPGVSGEYFPAKDYQAENKITLQAVDNITTNAAINIYDQADYRFRAGNTIILDNSFDARPSSTFIAEIGGCQNGGGSNQRTTDPTTELLNELSKIKVPKSKEFDMNKYAQGSILQSNNLFANIFPNPTKGDFSIKLSAVGNYKVEVSTIMGNIIYQAEYSNSSELKVQLSGYAAGTYIVQVSSATERFVGKVVLSE